MSQLGFTFYPKDWWTSDSFYILNPFERYIYLELLFMMYDNGGSIKNDKVRVERRLGTTIKDDVWSKITDLMVEDGDQLTNMSVNKRLSRAVSSRENGKKGGRPPKKEIEKPTKPNNETQNNPALEIGKEIESNTKEKLSNESKKKAEELKRTEQEAKARDQIKKLDAAKAATLKRKKDFMDSLVPYVPRYGKEMIRAFFDYWTEMNKQQTKMRIDKQSTWDLALRLGTWANREPIYGKTTTKEIQQPAGPAVVD